MTAEGGGGREGGAKRPDEELRGIRGAALGDPALGDSDAAGVDVAAAASDAV